MEAIKKFEARKYAYFFKHPSLSMLISFMLIEKRIYGPLGYKIIFEKFEKPSGPHT